MKEYTSLNSFRNSQQLMTGIKVGTNEHVFIKIRSFDINEEAKISILLSDCLGFPHFYYYGVEDSKSVLITSQLGKSLQNLFYDCNLNFSLKTLLMITDQLLERLEFLYHSGIVHGRISPEHILIDRFTAQNNPNTLYLINFEHAEKFRSNIENGVKVPFNLICQDALNVSSPSSTFEEIPLKKYSYDATSNAEDFLPVSALCKEDLTPKSDLESLVYVLVYFYNQGKLPWSNEKSTIDHKISILAEELCAGMPDEFTTFTKMIKALAPDDTPNYSEYRQLFRNLFMKNNYVYDGVFDWNKQKIISFSFNDNFDFIKSASSNANLFCNNNSNSSNPIPLSLSSTRKNLRSNPTFVRHSLTKSTSTSSPRKGQDNRKLEESDQNQLFNDSQENEIPITSDDLIYPQKNTDSYNKTGSLPKTHHKHKHKNRNKQQHMMKEIPSIDFNADNKSDNIKNKHRSNSLHIPQPPQNSSVPLFPSFNPPTPQAPSPSLQYFNAFKTISAPIPDLHGFTYTMKQAQTAAQEYVSSLPKRNMATTGRGRSFSVNSPPSFDFS